MRAASTWTLRPTMSRPRCSAWRNLGRVGKRISRPGGSWKILLVISSAWCPSTARLSRHRLTHGKSKQHMKGACGYVFRDGHLYFLSICQGSAPGTSPTGRDGCAAAACGPPEAGQGTQGPTPSGAAAHPQALPAGCASERPYALAEVGLRRKDMGGREPLASAQNEQRLRACRVVE